ncbi:potassium-transporting ATPase subunit KdpA [Paracoccus sp. SSK6]|uniref:potassium-transporting ATPase subunit KdpA n=1 Tax=Paracoccus sp. SSK6 TaxID=3143131 RepID=UPI00321B26C7
MTINGWLQILLYCGIIVILTRPLGGYMFRVFSGERTFLSPLLAPAERTILTLAGTSDRDEQHWTRYAASLLFFSVAGLLALYLLQRIQGALPLNPQDMPGVAPDLAFNTAVSFVANTNWQAYAGETTMSYLTQMMGMNVQNFLSAAAGMAVAVALIRGFARRSASSLGNFWVDVTRAVLHVLLPACIVGTLVLVWQGVPQNLAPYTVATTLEGGQQTIAQGPVASQMMIKHLGTNGGGFFNANASHPFENPTALTNLIHMVSILAIGAAFTNLFGRMAGDQRQGWAILAAMGVLFVIGVTVVYRAEAAGNPLIGAGGNWEGKETRFGMVSSALFAVVTTAASCGAVNAMHGSLTALGGMIPMLNMMLGEVVVGGVGAGMYGILLFVIVAIFIAGLMVGRTPEYLGKKIEGREVKMAMLALLVLPLVMLGLTAVAVVLPEALSSVLNGGPHGFSEILYAYVSAGANNGSAFASLSANTPWYNLTLGLAMLMGRFLMIVPILALAGSLGAKKTVPASDGTFPTHGPLFAALLIGVILVMGGLEFFPALALGPIVEHLAILAGQTF